MTVSFLIAAYNAQETLPKLVNKLLDQAGAVYPLEIVISEDDGFEYKDILPKDNRIVYAEKGLKSNPGPARDRALKMAFGSYICLMDADDDISDDYIKKIYKNLIKHKAFALKTVYKKDGEIVRELESKSLDFEQLSKFYGSVHTVAPKHWTKKYLNVVDQDVLATLNVLLKNNGKLPVIDAEYTVRLHKDSYCATRGSEFAEMYKNCSANAFNIAKELENPELGLKVKKFYEDRLEMREMFDKEVKNNPNINYHEFVLSKDPDKSEKLNKVNPSPFGRWY